jgi:hypothetical protein
MITRPMALARAMSVPTRTGSQRWAKATEEVLRGSTATRRAPRRTPRSRWRNRTGWVSRALEPHRSTKSVSSISR